MAGRDSVYLSCIVNTEHRGRSIVVDVHHTDALNENQFFAKDTNSPLDVTMRTFLPAFVFLPTMLVGKNSSSVPCWPTTSGLRCEQTAGGLRFADILAQRSSVRRRSSVSHPPTSSGGPNVPATNDSCRLLPRCDAIAHKSQHLQPRCGWCWDAWATHNQTHGGRAAGAQPADGPADGLGACNDWTSDSAECKNHVDCEGDVTNCVGILNTYCGWCEGYYLMIEHDIADILLRDNVDATSGRSASFLPPRTSRAARGSASGPANPDVRCSKWIWDHRSCKRETRKPEQVRLSFAGTAGETYAITFASGAAGGSAYVKLWESEVLVCVVVKLCS